MGVKNVRKANAENMSTAIMGLMDERFVEDWKSKLVAMGTDGASVMIGSKGGVVTRIAQATNHPFLRGVHCTAHR